MVYDMHSYQLAQMARHKLMGEASQHDHNLRHLVLHANFLDSLLVKLTLQEPEDIIEEEEEELVVREKSTKRKRRGSGSVPAAVVHHHTNLQQSTDPIILMKEVGEDAMEDDEEAEDPVPSLLHDSGSESDSDTESDDAASPTHSPRMLIAEGDLQLAQFIEEEEDLKLHRTSKSNWRYPQPSLEVVP
ncbi:hypothetical protein B0O99DRAFT_361279 [Bisporella sp. PMI_857]|nr:hypothetical protein B0O99DRAFT_361279 [Bisporella sp. PMI_857]